MTPLQILRQAIKDDGATITMRYDDGYRIVINGMTEAAILCGGKWPNTGWSRQFSAFCKVSPIQPGSGGRILTV